MQLFPKNIWRKFLMLQKIFYIKDHIEFLLSHINFNVKWYEETLGGQILDHNCIAMKYVFYFKIPICHFNVRPF